MAARKPAAKKTTTMKAPGKKPVSFKSGGLHQSLGVPAGQPIPPAKMQQALSGKAGPKAKAQAEFYQNVLKPGQKTAAANRSKSGGKSAGKGK